MIVCGWLRVIVPFTLSLGRAAPAGTSGSSHISFPSNSSTTSLPTYSATSTTLDRAAASAFFYGKPASYQNSTVRNITAAPDISSCMNLMLPIRPECWDILRVSDYLDDWWKNNSATCEANHWGFSFCYWASIDGAAAPADCNTTGPGHCARSTNWAHLDYSPLEVYTFSSIFGIWQFFQSLYDGILSADVSASGPIGEVVRLINPQKQSSATLGTILQALSVFAPMIAVPSKISYGIIKDSTIMEAILRQAPNVARYMTPVGTLDSQVVQWSQISEGLSIVKDTYQQNISSALKEIQNHYKTFSSFAQHGNFIATGSDLQVQTENLTRSMQTYVIGAALTSTNIVITAARDTNPMELVRNGTMTIDLIKCDKYNEWGMCGEWWYDKQSNIAYGLSNIGAPGKKYSDTLQKMFSKGWTTPELLFRGAKSCQDYLAVKGGNNTPMMDITTMAPRCVPNTQVCVFDTRCQPQDQECLYTSEYGGGRTCRPPVGYIVDGCKGNAEGEMITVNLPNSYLGPMTHTPYNQGIFCNA